MWFNCWTSGFPRGVGCWQEFFSCLPYRGLCGFFCRSLLVLRPCRQQAWLWLVCGFGWGSFHNAPFPTDTTGSGAKHTAQSVAVFFQQPCHYRCSTAALASAGLSRQSWQCALRLAVQQRYFIFARPPNLHHNNSIVPAPAIVLTPRLHLLRKTDSLLEPVRSWIASITLGQRKQMPRTLSGLVPPAGVVPYSRYQWAAHHHYCRCGQEKHRPGLSVPSTSCVC